MGNDEHGPAYPEPPNDSINAMLSEGEYSLDHGRTWHRGSDRDAILAMINRTRKPKSELSKPNKLVWFFAGVCVGLLILLFTTPAPAMDHGFNPTNPTVKWFESKMVPNISFPQSCCGKGDAYPVERVRRNTDHTWSVWLADGSEIKYPDGTHRAYFDKNIEIVVPDINVNPPDDDLDNPTDVGWIFMRVSTPAQPGAIYCVIIHPEGD